MLAEWHLFNVFIELKASIHSPAAEWARSVSVSVSQRIVTLLHCAPELCRFHVVPTLG